MNAARPTHPGAPAIRRLAALALAAMASAASAQVESSRFQVTPGSAAVVAGGAIALWGASAIETSKDEVTACRWCEPGRFDVWVRDELRWRSGGGAGRASDLLLVGLPLGSAAAVGWLASREGGRREVVEDLFVLAAAIAMTDSLTTGVKHATGRLRPGAWARGGSRGEGDLHSFFSGHTSRVFAAASAAAQIARVRKRTASRWIAVAGFAAAAATGWLRIAADQHWATDVLAGAAVGTAAGWGVATVALRPVGERSSTVAFAALPAGISISIPF